MKKSWKLFPRPLMESILNSHVAHDRVHQPLILHGPRGVGKTTMILERLLEGWNKSPHLTAYVDFANSTQIDSNVRPWTSWLASHENTPSLSDCRAQLENSLEELAWEGVCRGAITSTQIFSTLHKWHRLDTALFRIMEQHSPGSSSAIRKKLPASVLWEKAVSTLSARRNAPESNKVLNLGAKQDKLTKEEASFYREAAVALTLAKQVLDMQLSWRSNAISDLNKSNRFSRPLANASTNWPCLLIELLSQSAEAGHFQPKLVINNVEILKLAASNDDGSMVHGPLYHDSLIWRIIALGVNVKCMPVVLVTSDSYYSHKAFVDFGFPDIFISREFFGWSVEQAEIHMVPDYFSDEEWKMVANVLGPNCRHLSELYTLKINSYYDEVLDDKAVSFEDLLDTYLAHLQVTVVDPAMEKAMAILVNFAKEARENKIPETRLRFGSAWRHPPAAEDPITNADWAKLHLMDYVHGFVHAEFGLNYATDPSLEIFDDPCTGALIEVGLIYCQRDPPFLRPLSIGIQRCIVRWLVKERIMLSRWGWIRYWWHRMIRGRYYRHLMNQVGYNK